MREWNKGRGEHSVSIDSLDYWPGGTTGMGRRGGDIKDVS